MNVLLHPLLFVFRGKTARSTSFKYTFSLIENDIHIT